MIKWIGTILLCLFLISCSSTSRGNSSCFQIPVHFLSCSDAPMVRVNIEGSEYVLMLDLGANLHLMLKSRVLQKLQHKEPAGTSSAIDIHGNKYAQPKFKLDAYKIGNFYVKNPEAIEESLLLVNKGSKISTNSNDRRTNQKIEQIDGKIGTEFFLSCGKACFLDMSRSFFCIGETLQDLTKNDSLAGFLEGQLEMENGCLCLNIQTNCGLKRFLLDTGAERSVIKKSPTDPQKIKLSLGSLGSWNFYTFNFPEGLLPIDGILGIDFLKKHPIYLDFQNSKIYIQ